MSSTPSVSDTTLTWTGSAWRRNLLLLVEKLTISRDHGFGGHVGRDRNTSYGPRLWVDLGVILQAKGLQELLDGFRLLLLLSLRHQLLPS